MCETEDIDQALGEEDRSGFTVFWKRVKLWSLRVWEVVSHILLGLVSQCLQFRSDVQLECSESVGNGKALKGNLPMAPESWG